MKDRPEVPAPAPATEAQPLDPVALTGRLTAALRARESASSDRLFLDPFADRLAGEEGRRLLEVFGENSTIAVRTRFFDDELTQAARSGPRQIVILAAGMDTRAYRLDFPAGTQVFELDRDEVLRVKDQLLSQPSGSAPEPRCRRRPLGVDLASDWSEPLTEAGFDASRPTCWLAEGLTQYLTASDVGGLLDRVTSLSAGGSVLFIDFVGQSLLDSPVMRPLIERFAEHGAPWRYGTDRPEDLLTPRGWQPDTALISTVGTRMGRWPYPDVPRDTPGVGQGFFVRARR
ncbi:SAM-dependent methyltransferase [Streptomyces sp. HNM0575]|uniref:class I SAM-dependent methyltransferase n=1 Tax=Streptomyces sp. HNM0575 TaxID=2716338 RepID=UPI00145FC8D3|nr:SAM-dependent methyltransferase [Streptomyces sp. HNM0575]NLU75249.1 SAM-dependent methyltransferase [Streptomyces sp. HNM0575]